MKKNITILLVCISGVISSQENITTAEIKESNINSLRFSVEELKSINWNDIKDVFNENINKDKKIILGFNVKNNNIHSFEIKGSLSDLEGTIEIAKKVIKVIEKL
ncbi:hypothetical protein CXF68_07455 [Tenacibaculum sp. Bg11-29]|uniref:hypothetical protein n=1 Tax=Tenacibaculum sp. Bg11-29 TaxID=2058306 RepID=UPI000C32EF33|nr:hypothetical protein [Tenacibaculum sp. Bg11-29]PKH50542.1 hypothetical protein CXF68_07455 [Tenacibaculum sp. Bg11-29]